jgi:[ribosomal protein S5]-alanine N-acetyltransferase
MIKIRLQKVSDAKRFYEILNNPNFIYFNVSPKTIKAEREWLKLNKEKIKNNSEWNYAITYNEKVIGAIGVMIHSRRNYIGEIGFFVDEKYWGKNITSTVVKLIEGIWLKESKLTRIEIIMQTKNKASEKVAIKNNYRKEGLLRKYIKGKDGKMKDCYLYAKVI